MRATCAARTGYLPTHAERRDIFGIHLNRVPQGAGCTRGAFTHLEFDFLILIEM
jgi:hypothetical protein